MSATANDISEDLIERRERFVEEYMVDFNGTQAAIRAGYSPKTAYAQASRLLRDVHVRAAVARRQKELRAATRVTQEYVIERIKETVERCRQAFPVKDRNGKRVFVAGPDGIEVPAYCFDAKNVLRGCEMLGKHLGLFSDAEASMRITANQLPDKIAIVFMGTGNDRRQRVDVTTEPRQDQAASRESSATGVPRETKVPRFDLDFGGEKASTTNGYHLLTGPSHS